MCLVRTTAVLIRVEGHVIGAIEVQHDEDVPNVQIASSAYLALRQAEFSFDLAADFGTITSAQCDEWLA